MCGEFFAAVAVFISGSLDDARLLAERLRDTV